MRPDRDPEPAQAIQPREVQPGRGAEREERPVERFAEGTEVVRPANSNADATAASQKHHARGNSATVNTASNPENSSSRNSVSS